MAQLFLLSFISIISIASATVAEYQLDSQPLLPCELAREKALVTGEKYVPQCSDEGFYRNVQCARNGATCWCVGADGTEVPGSRVTESPATCLSFCQLTKQQILVSGYINSSSTSYVPRCSDSGEYEPVQCDQQQCWCVDTEGMEIYGTRQMAEPAQCPQRCAVRGRRILHDVGEKVLPHCTKDGGFQPVQCKLVNTTDQMVFDVVTSFSRFPNAFKSFTSLRESFPEMSGYCYCADSLGRELAGTGLEMLLGDVYDTVFSTLSSPRSFTETAIYRILQRRFLGVQLITAGRFRCPSACEVQRFTSSQMGDVYVPSCDDNGDYEQGQCQAGGQCWCVDSMGREISGSRILGDSPKCIFQDCKVRRRQVLSALFHGPTGHFGEHSMFLTQEEELGAKISTKFCPSYVVETFFNSGLRLQTGNEAKDLKLQLDSFIRDLIDGLFSSKEQIQFALRFISNPVGLQKNLFGGKYLKNLASFNFTGAIGTQSKFSFSDFFQQIGLTGMYSGGNFRELAKLFSTEEDSYLTKDSSNFSKPDFNLNQPILASFGRSVNLKENQDRVAFFSSILELKEFSKFLRDVISIPPNIAEDVYEAVKIIIGSKDCEERPTGLFVPTCTKEGRYEQIQCSKSDCWCVDGQGQEIQGSRTRDKQPRCPSKCEQERQSQIAFRKSQPAGSAQFIPACNQKGDYLRVQCAGKNCFCVDVDGRNIPGTEKLSGEDIQCPSDCQLAAGKAFLQAASSLLSKLPTPPEQVYIPQCSPSGEWRMVQYSGPTEQAFELYERWTAQNANVSFSETLQVLLKYKESSLQSFSSFVQTLYENGHQNVFPVFSKYSLFGDVPGEILAGNVTMLAPANVLLNPYIFWRLLSMSLTYYPGSYRDFSVPLGHFEKRIWWCVDRDGQKLRGSETVSNKPPKCPRTCEIAKQKTLQFIEEARGVITASNASLFPPGYSFLLANGIRLSPSDLLYTEEYKSWVMLFEGFWNKETYALQLAAYSTLKFFWQGRFNTKETTGLLDVPYTPQCDVFGNWEPVQFYQGTGHYWCVDDDGNYITGSLVKRTTSPPQCLTSCQKTETNTLISSWMPRKFSAIKTGTSDVFIPSCTQTGQYYTLQKLETDFWCVNPVTGEVIPQDTRTSERVKCPGLCTVLKSEHNSLGQGFIPTCDENENLSREQCDPERILCYCVFTNGEEASGTQVIMSEKSGPSCQVPLCPLPFGAQDIEHGSVFCEEILESGEKLQKCQVKCHSGYNNIFSSSTFTCHLKTKRWVPQPPHVRSCRRVEFFHTVQTQAWFQVLLPAGKMCTADYSGLLQAFRIFILDDLRSRGLCHIQVNNFGSSGDRTITACDDSTIHVECLSSSRLGVNVTWTVQLGDIPESFLPSLPDVESAVVVENLVGRLSSVIRSGGYSLNLDSKQFVADKSSFLPQDASTQVRLGCGKGFQRLLNSKTDIRNVGGCGICPAGSYSESGGCTPCPVGSYQETPGSSTCQRCPLGTTTAYAGSYNQSHCITSCQMNERGLLCDDKGQYLPSQRDRTTNKYFCATNSGEKLKWTESDLELTSDQCLLLQKFDLVAEEQLVVINEGSKADQSRQVTMEKKHLLDCIVDCATDESCDYLTVSTNQTGAICQQYTWDGSNIVCTAANQTPTTLGNTASINMEGLRCQYKINLTAIDNVTVYRKKGEEFSGHRDFERTDFGNTISGVYSTMLFSASGGTLTDGYYLCRQTCVQDSCCDGFILSRIILNQGTTLCGLLRSPDVLLCGVNDWSTESKLGGDGVCRGVRSNKKQKMFSFFLGGQEFTGSYSLLSQSIGMVEYNTELSDETKEEIQALFSVFQRVFLRRDVGKTLINDSGCSERAPRKEKPADTSGSAMELFLSLNSSDVVINEDISVANTEFWISKEHYSSDQALSWCLTRCAEEESWCRLADLQDSKKEFFTCIIYPDSWSCDTVTNRAPANCDIALNNKPQSLYHRKETFGNKVKHFYTPIPYRKLADISVRNRVIVTGTSVSNGFFQCELRCDADPCCKGFGYMQRPGIQERMCLMLASLGIQSCSEDAGYSWRVVNCSLPNEGMETLPFGWYQKPVDRQTNAPAVCPPVDVTYNTDQEVSVGEWLIVDSSSVVIDPSLSKYDTVRISRTSPSTLSREQRYCLSECAAVQSCVTTTVTVQETTIRCMFYPETQICDYNLKGHRCQLMVKEAATYIYRKRAPTRPLTPVTISHGAVLGKFQSVLIGSDVKNVDQYLGVPYAAPPTGENRFRPPQPFTWTGTRNATFVRSSCLQPGDGKAQYSSVSEDCLYLNIFIPQNYRTNAAVLLYFHNSPSDYSENGQTFIDGSYLAAVGDIIVITASYRVGLFGFLRAGNTVPNGNWGLFDQTAALTWIQENIAYFGGDPEQISIAADGPGADVASVHLLLPETRPFRRAALMGGSAFSPMLIVSERRAQEQAKFLASEVGCLSSGNEDTLECLRKVDANTLNTAQTKLLALRGPFQTWGPVVDSIYLRDIPSRLLQQTTFQNIDLFIGSSEHDGLISRAKAIKRFEESQGRGESKMAFYQALQNSLGGEEMNKLVQDAAVWFYSLQHSTEDYSGFSRALENSTRDHFIACPTIKMAEHWSENQKGSVYMYYVPETFSQSSSGLDLPEDIVYAFGIPFHSNYRNQFSTEEQNLSLKIMQYLANFVKSGNPNFPYIYSRKRNSALPSWTEYLSHSNGDNYKEFTKLLPSHQGLKRAECSFWNDYVPALKLSTNLQTGSVSTKNSFENGPTSAVTRGGRKQAPQRTDSY
ncbi:thyroglobulin [Mixophyes fleayi]|uniref:thyroglobulin n=1 Tax=Mixophyes fleayi TaxID=3061075 RepID=UPI003F4DE15C